MVPSLTFFTLPTGFDARGAVPQRNAVRSWQLVSPGAQVILVGDVPEAEDARRAPGADWLPAVERTPYGAPLLSSVFALAEQRARHDLLCFTNPDLIFLPDLLEALRPVLRRKRFVAVGRTRDVDLEGAELVGLEGWEEELRSLARREGFVRGRNWVDFVVFTRGALGPLPPFAGSGPWWGNWLIWHARRLGLPVVDISEAALVVHQRHPDEELGGERSEPAWDAAARTNAELIRGSEHYSIRDATHVVHEGRVVPAGGSAGFRIRNAVAAPWSPAKLRRALQPRSPRRRLHEIARSSVGAWDSDADLAATVVAPAATVERAGACAGILLGPGVPRLAGEDPGSYVAPAAELLRIRGGMVDTGMAVPFSPSAGFVGSAIRKDRHRMEAQGYRFPVAGDGAIVFPARPRRVIDRPALLLALPFRDNYFHWLIENLGKLLLTRELLPAGTLLAVQPHTSAGFARELLVEAIGSDEALYTLPEDHVVVFRELYVPPVTVLSSARTFPPDRSLDFQLHPDAVRAVRSLAPPRTRGGERLYVTRGRRKPVNEEEVAAMLESHGFTRLDAETLSVREQMELFANAEVVVGAHGAGLANVVFATDALVVELQSNRVPQGFRSLYWNLAAICGLRWACVVGSVPEPWASPDFHVDCELLEDALTRHLTPA